ncbi:MAG: ArdC-like ssDNA-binding domain-containing protein [Candidatus Woesearchaeota archaeon]
MKYYGKTEEVCNKIIEQFENGDIPQKLAPIFVNVKNNIPSVNWSWTNRLVMIMNRTTDARTFKQWNNVGRKVKKGSSSFTILGPVIKSVPKKEKDNETGEESTNYIKILVGFKPIHVFRIEDTEVYDQELWDKKSGVDKEEKERLENLPLREVAEKWNLDVSSFNAKGTGALGYYHGERIVVGVKNLSVWCHELVHAADDKNGTLVKNMGQNPENEIVAELGSSVLLQILGFDHESDIGGAYEYIKNYADGDEKKTIKKCMNLINRVCECVNLILEESNDIIES